MIDSQYNLAILYARGIGVELNFVESYKWFALAGREGDKDSLKKRDDVGARIDPQSLATVRNAVASWSPEPQPEAATQVKVPPGGWDAAPAPPAKSRTASPRTPASPKRHVQ